MEPFARPVALSFAVSPLGIARPTLSARMARWGLAIVGIYIAVALFTPVLISVGLLPDPNAGLDNAIYAAPSPQH